jgi:serine/threonine protein kinase
MDMIEGRDLHELLREKSLTQRVVLEALEKVCDAVDYAHKQGVIHRDLKPANIIVRPDNFPVLTDFGLAKNLESPFKLTAEGALIGTPLYLSPEQVAGKANLVDGRCDVYGLGVMLYQVLTDRMPFMGRNPYEIYRKITDEDPELPTAIDPTIAPDLEKICLMALAKNRDERYATAKALGDDIGRHLRGEPVTAVVPKPTKPAGPKGSAAHKSADKPSPPPVGSGRRIVVAVIVLVILAGLAVIGVAVVTN